LPRLSEFAADLPPEQQPGMTSGQTEKEIAMKIRVALVSSFSLFVSLGVPAQAQNATPRYVIRDLGALPGGGFSQPGTLNDAGVVAGVSVASDGFQHAVLWVGGQIFDLNHSGDHGLNTQAFGINSLGRVSIQTETSTYDPNGEDFCLYGTGRECVAAVWQGGRFVPLPTLGGNNGTVGNVNSFGQIAGVTETAVSDPSCAFLLRQQKLLFRAVIWGPDLRSVKPLRLLGNDTVSFALWINDKGQAVGGSGACSNTQPPAPAYGSHAVLWEADGTPVDLGNLGSAAGNAGIGINNFGEVVGASWTRDDANVSNGSFGFLWTRQHGMKNLGALSGDVASAALAINDSGEIVGVSTDPAGNNRATYWHNGRPVDLNTQVAAGSNLYLLFAAAINNRGEITGWGLDTSTGEIHTYVAVPNRMHDGSIPDVQFDLPAIAPRELPNELRQRLLRGYLGRHQH
jgi:probable HAF family extracellular repeat protein